VKELLWCMNDSGVCRMFPTLCSASVRMSCTKHVYHIICLTGRCSGSRLRLKCDGRHAKTRFHLSAKRTSPFKSAGSVSSVNYWQASCAHQPAGFVLLVQACVLQSCDTYWLPTPFSCFPFTSPPVCHRVPSHFNWTLLCKLYFVHM
jgi:hypothetical protein